MVKPEDVIDPEIFRFYQEKRGWLICNEDIFNKVELESLVFLDKNFERTKRNIFGCGALSFPPAVMYFFVPETGKESTSNTIRRLIVVNLGHMQNN